MKKLWILPLAAMLSVASCDSAETADADKAGTEAHTGDAHNHAGGEGGDAHNHAGGEATEGGEAKE